MPATPRFHSRAFTLIELLTVIAIIGILAAILIPAVTAAKNAARRAQTKTQLTQWATAMTGFKQEYGYYPSIATAGKVDSSKFWPALTGKTQAGATPAAAASYGNTKLIGFYSITQNDIDPTNAGAPVLQDAFGNVDIAVKIDVNGDGKIDAAEASTDTTIYPAGWPTVQAGNPAAGTAFAPTKADDNLAANGVRAGVVFYTAGRGTADKDIVTTWQ